MLQLFEFEEEKFQSIITKELPSIIAKDNISTLFLFTKQLGGKYSFLKYFYLSTFVNEIKSKRRSEEKKEIRKRLLHEQCENSKNKVKKLLSAVDLEAENGTAPAGNVIVPLKGNISKQIIFPKNILKFD